MIEGPHYIQRTALDRVIEKPAIIQKLGRAIWLYVAFVSAASKVGIVCRTSDRLAKDLGIPEDKIKDWLDRLVKADLVLVSSPPPFLVARLKTWPGSEQETRVIEAKQRIERSLQHREVPVGSKAAAASKQSEDGGAGEGETLLEETVKALGGADRETIERLLDRYPEEVIRRALTRVRNTPESQIRKSREALFRYLLTRLSHNAP